MKFVSVRDFRLKPGDIWRKLKINKDIIITSNGKPIAILNEINSDNLECSLTVLRRSRALIAMEEMQQKVKEAGIDKMSEKDIEEEIGKFRVERKRAEKIS